jgi:hypothetical protein
MGARSFGETLARGKVRSTHTPHPLEVELRIFPIDPGSVATLRRALETNLAVVFDHELDIVASEEPFTFGAHSHLAQRPPELAGIALAKEEQFPSRGIWI